MAEDQQPQKKQSIPELREKAKGIRKLLHQVESIPGVGNVGERVSDSERKNLSRRKGRLVVIPPCEDRARRERLEADTEAWLLWYFGEESGTLSPFWYQFVEQQKDMIRAIDETIASGRDKAYAASRGEGKTTICLRVTLKNVLQGKARFPVIFGATKAAADDGLDAIKTELDSNERLYADYPEVCVPIRALEGVPQKAHSQLVSGHRHDDGKAYAEAQSHFVWCGKGKIILPNVPGSPAAGAIIATRGLDGAVRGLNLKGRRPDVGIIDDPDTERTAVNEKAAAKLEFRIDRGIAGLGGQKRRLARVMITTLQSRYSVSYKYTDPKQKPSFNGTRNRFLVERPQRLDLWEEFVDLKKNDFIAGTNKAHEFYLKNRKAMDVGAVVSNHNRFTADESSALEFYYSEVARIGQDCVDTEYDNNPAEVDATSESLLTATHVQKKISGYKRKLIPKGCTLITHSMDVRKSHIHWVVRAWRPDGVAYYTIDHGIDTVLGTARGDGDVGIEHAIYKAILQRWDDYCETDYCTEDGEIIDEQITLVDAGYQTDAVYCACLTIGPGIFPIMGFGKSAGCVKANFADVEKETPDRKPGDGWFLARKPVKAVVPEIRRKKKEIWLVCADTDRWKRWEHARWLTGRDQPGSMYIFGERDEEAERRGRLSAAQSFHKNYAHQIVAELEVEKVVKGKLKKEWTTKSETHHFLDASYYGDVGANMKGIRLITKEVLRGPDEKPISKAKAKAPLKPKRKPTRRVIYDNEP